MREVPPMPNQAHSKSQYKRLSTLGADVAPPPDWMRQEALTLPGDWPNHPRAHEIVAMIRSRDAIWAGMLEEAVREERERCAQIAESDEFYGNPLQHAIAAAIREKKHE